MGRLIFPYFGGCTDCAQIEKRGYHELHSKPNWKLCFRFNCPNHLYVRTWFLKNQVGQTRFLTCKNQFENWFSQTKQSVKISSLNSIFPTWFFKNQVQMDRANDSFLHLLPNFDDLWGASIQNYKGFSDMIYRIGLKDFSIEGVFFSGLLLWF